MIAQECLDCEQSSEHSKDFYCRMFKHSPKLLPCAQHDKFKDMRIIIGKVVLKHPELLKVLAIIN